MEHKAILWKRYLLTSMVLIICITTSLAQISGTVKDVNGDPMVGASVIQKGTTNGVVTDVNGLFTMNVPVGTALKFSSVGYNDLEMPAENNMIVVMSEDAEQIDDVVITGYGGTVSKAKATSSISSLNKQVLQTGVRSNPAQALAGTIPGLRVSTTSGRPGSMPEIILRGGTNYDGTSNAPLVIVDGQIRGSLSDINQEDIESMDVLKDAASTSIYGARASNGVILITTKRGKAGHSSIQVKAQVGVNFMNTPYEFTGAEEYLYWFRKGYAQYVKENNPAGNSLYSIGGPGTGNMYKDPITGKILDGNYDNRAIFSTMRLDEINRELLEKGTGWRTMKDPIPTNTTGQYDPNGQYYDLIFKEFNYADYAFNTPSITQDYNVSVSGGNEKGSYYANLGYYDEKGFPINSFYRRFTGVLNGDYQIKKWLKSETNINYTKANWDDGMYQAGEGNYWARSLSAQPTFRGTNENGEMLYGHGGSDQHPLINEGKFIRDNQTDKFTLGQYFKFSIVDGLQLRLGGILMYDEGVYESFNKDYRSASIMSLTNPATGWTRTRVTSAEFGRTFRQTYNAVLTYKKTFARSHNIDAMVGAEFYDTYQRGFRAQGQDAPTDDFQDLALTSTAATLRTIDSWHGRERIMSYFGRVNYDFDSKYLFSFTLRGDGYSRLLGDNRWGVFPGVSAGWLIHRENFMESTKDWLSTLKIRLSYGINGNVGPIGTYTLQGSMSTPGNYMGNLSYGIGVLPNPDLRWEQSKTWEPALELGFLQNRIMASISYYNRITDNKVGSIMLPISSGERSLGTNNGSIQNQGIEFELNATVLQIQDFKWTAGLNGAWNWNKVLKLPDNGLENNRQGGSQIFDPKSGKLIWVGGYQEGQEPGEIFGYVSEGIIRTEQDRINYKKVDLAAGEVQYGNAAGRKVINRELYSELVASGKNIGAANSYYFTDLGDMKWKDLDGNDTIDFRDRVSLGRTIPRFTGGFNTSLSWKGITLYARIDFAFGHVQQDVMHLWALGCFQGAFAPTTLVRDTWTPENPNAKYPRYMWADQLNQKNFDRPSSMFWKNSSYLSFREISLSYDLPKSILDKIKMQGLRITCTAQNLGYISDELLNLPERSGSQGGAYIIPTGLIFGTTLTF